MQENLSVPPVILIEGDEDPQTFRHFDQRLVTGGDAGGRVGENVTADDSPPLFTREESVRLYAAYAREVLGVSLSEFLAGCASRREMTPGEAQAVLVEARELGLVSVPRLADADPRGPEECVNIIGPCGPSLS